VALEDFLAPDGVLFLREGEKLDALREMVDFFCSLNPCIDPEGLHGKVRAREEEVSTWVARGIAIPHAIVAGFGPSRIALGVSREGISYGAPDGAPVHLLVLIVGEGAEHLQVLRQVATRLGIPQVYQDILSASTEEEIFRILVREEEPPVSLPAEGIEVSRACFTYARRLAKEVGARFILVHADGVEDHLPFSPHSRENIFFVTLEREEELKRRVPENRIIPIPFKGITRTNQIDLSIIFALSRGLLQKEQRVVSVFGRPRSGVLDSMRVTDIEKEFRIFFSLNSGVDGLDLENRVLVRIIEIAGELAVEGREGKPSGAIFVMGDYDQVRLHCQQMIINPFKGYPEEERNVLDPSLKETIKELSKIDGAFIIRGDGVLVSVGTYIRTRIPPTGLPPGLGSRHAAAAAITMVSQAVSVALSESTRKISIFKNGERIMEL